MGGRVMKETILDVLLYLFENDHAGAVRSGVPEADSAGVSPLFDELTAAGFGPGEIQRAFGWLDALALQRPAHGPAARNAPLRVYHGDELDRLDVDCRGFLLSLEQLGVLNAEQRELVLDRALALDQDRVELDDLKWVVLMVLFNQPGSEAAYAWMETRMFADDPEPLH